MDGELGYLNGQRSVDVETYIPNVAKKKLNEIEYFNVILIKNNKIVQNNLFNDLGAAENNFVNLICEYCEAPMPKSFAEGYLWAKYFPLQNGFIALNQPNVNLK